jgi:hypothetical protein
MDARLKTGRLAPVAGVMHLARQTEYGSSAFKHLDLAELLFN